jgi:hypothetical protein
MLPHLEEEAVADVAVSVVGMLDAALLDCSQNIQVCMVLLVPAELQYV